MSAPALHSPSALQRLEARLRGSQPRHEREAWRFGAMPVAQLDAPLRDAFPAKLVPAAVLVGLVDHPGDPALLLTVRAHDLRAHAGQIAFPGGRMEPGDCSPAEAALREAHEEVGLDPGSATILGYLPDQVSVTGFRVTPVVAQLPESLHLSLDSREVSEVFELPWSTLIDDSRHAREERSFGGVRVTVHSIHHAGHRIWGLTAAILMQLRELGTST